jgi:hypothetical protein
MKLKNHKFDVPKMYNSDYEALLIKYVSLVVENEGVDFIRNAKKSKRVKFTEQELKELEWISVKVSGLPRIEQSTETKDWLKVDVIKKQKQ